MPRARLGGPASGWVAGTAFVWVCLGVSPRGLLAQERAASPSPSPSASPAARAPSLLGSIERAVDKVETEERAAPCEIAAKAGVPCFPAKVELQGPRYSVAESLRQIDGHGGPEAGAPTAADMKPPSRGGVSFDPVCDARKLVRLLGNGKAYYVYRVTDRSASHAAISEGPLDTAGRAPDPDIRVELVGKFSGECEALAAFRSIDRLEPGDLAKILRPPAAGPQRP